MTSNGKKETGFSYTGHGVKLPKDDILFEALGSIDELNAHIGLIIAEMIESENHKTLKTIQRNLSSIMSELAFRQKKNAADETAVFDQNRHLSSKNDSNGFTLKELNDEIVKLKKHTGSIKEFTQPGINKISSTIHIARTVCRRAERKAVALQRTYSISPDCLEYLNKLSEYLFYLALIEEKDSNS